MRLMPLATILVLAVVAVFIARNHARHLPDPNGYSLMLAAGRLATPPSEVLNLSHDPFAGSLSDSNLDQVVTANVRALSTLDSALMLDWGIPYSFNDQLEDHLSEDRGTLYNLFDILEAKAYWHASRREVDEALRSAELLIHLGERLLQCDSAALASAGIGSFSRAYYTLATLAGRLNPEQRHRVLAQLREYHNHELDLEAVVRNERFVRSKSRSWARYFDDVREAWSLQPDRSLDGQVARELQVEIREARELWEDSKMRAAFAVHEGDHPGEPYRRDDLIPYLPEMADQLHTPPK